MTDLNFIQEYTRNGRELTKEKIEYLTSNSKLKGYVGNRQCGKTYLLYQDLICNAFNNPGDYLVVAPNFPTLRVIQQYIRNCLEDFILDFEPVSVFPSHTIKKISNGSTITFISGVNVNEGFIRGRNYKAVYIDEPRFITRILDLLDLLTLVVARDCGYVSVFGTVNMEFATQLEEIGFKLIYSKEGYNGL